MDGFTRRKERIKESIMNAALELFHAHGLKKVSINEIAAKADVSPVSIYNHFGSKQGLTKEVLKKLFEQIYERQKNIVEADMPYLEKMQNLLSAKMNAAYEFKGELFQADIYNNLEMKQYLTDIMVNKSYKLMMDFFEEGKGEGYINPELSPQSIMTFIEIFRLGWIAFTNPPGDPQQLSLLIRDLFNMSFYGLMGKPSDKPNFDVAGKES